VTRKGHNEGCELNATRNGQPRREDTRASPDEVTAERLSNREKELYSLSINQQIHRLQPATTVNDAEDQQCPEISSGCSSVYVASRTCAGVVLTISQKYNSNVVKRLPEGPLFSKEAVCHLSLFIYVPGCRSHLLKANLLNIHSHKYSGLANSKVSHL